VRGRTDGHAGEEGTGRARLGTCATEAAWSLASKSSTRQETSSFDENLRLFSKRVSLSSYEKYSSYKFP